MIDAESSLPVEELLEAVIARVKVRGVTKDCPCRDCAGWYAALRIAEAYEASQAELAALRAELAEANDTASSLSEAMADRAWDRD